LVLLKALLTMMCLTQLALLSGCTNLIFQPNNVRYYTPESFDIKHEEVFMKTRDNLRLHGWWLKSGPAKKANIIYLHGNAQNISSHVANVAWLTKQGYDVFIFDYRGYGYSQGEVDLAGIMHDAMDAIAYGAERSAREDIPVYVMAQSLGASLAVYAVASSEFKEKIKALMIVSAFSDFHNITREVLSNWWLTWALQWPLSFTVNNDFRPLDHVANITPVPLAVLHSREDEIIPYHHATDLFEAATQPKTFIEITGSHNAAFVVENNKNLIIKYLDGLLK